MNSARTLTILSRRFPEKRVFVTGAGGDRDSVRLRGYRLVWRLKRHFPTCFLKRVLRFRDAQLKRAADPPRG